MVLFLAICLFGETANPAMRLAILNDPNQNLGGQIHFRIEGVPHGKTVFLEVAIDCNQDLNPDFNDLNNCNGIIYEFQSNTSVRGVIQDVLYLKRDKFPAKGQFWIRARLPGQSQGRRAMFGIGLTPCSLYKTLMDTFFGRECEVRLARMFEPLRNRDDWEYRRFELVLWDSRGRVEQKLARTKGVSGFAWVDQNHLLLTIKTGSDKGLYYLDLSTSKMQFLSKGNRFQAPFVWRSGQFGFIQRNQDHTGTIYLDGTPVLELPVALDQIVVSKPQSGNLLGLFLGEDGVSPTFFEVDLGKGTFCEMGFHTLLYQNAMQSPVEGLFLVQRFDYESQGESWFEVVKGGSTTIHTIGKQNAAYSMLGAWSPDGSRIGYLRSIPD